MEYPRSSDLSHTSDGKKPGEQASKVIRVRQSRARERMGQLSFHMPWGMVSVGLLG